jgi:hypothetical protein
MHLYHVVGVFVMFMLAQGVHGWQRASEAVNSKLNGIGNYDEYLHRYASELSCRVLLVSFIFGGWTSGELPTLIGYIAPSTAATMISHPLAVNWWTAGLLGYFGDSVIFFVIGLVARFWPGVRQEVPPTPQATAEKKAAA